ncbi:MAG TPA: glycosyltransferase family A protein [Pseudomonadales bacterium]|nr:glycosyltransferase family A protein [Pseudomonadales bacterium]
MSESPVSIVMPVFNREYTVADAIDSVIRQTYADWELVAVDDGSSDGSADVIRRYDDPRIRLYTRPHVGNIARVRNFGLQRTNGRYIAHLDSDDIWRDDKLEVHMTHFRADPLLGVAISGGVQFGNDADAMPVHGTRVGQLFKQLVFDQRYYLLTSSVMVDRRAKTLPLAFNEKWSSVSEVDYIFRAFHQTRGVYIGQPLVKYRKHDGNYHKTLPDSWVTREMLEMYEALHADAILSRTQYKRLSARLTRKYPPASSA